MNREIITDKQSFEKISEKWNSLADRFGTPLLRHEWFSCCLQAFYQENQLSILILHERDEIIAAAPFVLVKQKTTYALELIGVSWLNEPCGFLFKDTSALKKLLRAVAKLRKTLALSRIQSGNIIFHELKNIARYKGFVVHRQTTPSLLVQCNTTWDNYYSSISSKRRYDHRRAYRRAEQIGAIRFEICKPAMNNYMQILSKAFQIEAAGWKGKRNSALQCNKELSVFFTNYAKITSNDGRLRFFFMYIDGTPVAMQLCIEHADRLWVLKIGYDEKWAYCSPGVLLMNFAIKYAFEQNLVAFEFLGSNESWLEVWANSENTYGAIAYYPFTLNSIMKLGGDVLRLGKRKIQDRVTQHHNS